MSAKTYEQFGKHLRSKKVVTLTDEVPSKLPESRHTPSLHSHNELFLRLLHDLHDQRDVDHEELCLWHLSCPRLQDREMLLPVTQ